MASLQTINLGADMALAICQAAGMANRKANRSVCVAMLAVGTSSMLRGKSVNKRIRKETCRCSCMAGRPRQLRSCRLRVRSHKIRLAKEIVISLPRCRKSKLTPKRNGYDVKTHRVRTSKTCKPPAITRTASMATTTKINTAAERNQETRPAPVGSSVSQKTNY